MDSNLKRESLKFQCYARKNHLKKLLLFFHPMEFVLYLLHNATDVAWLAQLGERRSAEQDITG